jgi:hypothetical protein
MAQDKFDNVNRNRKTIFINNLIGGVAWGIGATIGLALLIAILGVIGSYIDLVPIVGNFVSEVIEHIVSKNQSL